MPRSDLEGGKGQSAGGWEGHTPSGPRTTGASSSFGASFVAAVWPSSGVHTPDAAQNIHSLRFSKAILQRWFNRQRSYRRAESVSMRVTVSRSELRREGGAIRAAWMCNCIISGTEVPRWRRPVVGGAALSESYNSKQI